MFNSHWYKWGRASLALSQATKFVQFSSTGIIIMQMCITGLFMSCTIFILSYHIHSLSCVTGLFIPSHTLLSYFLSSNRLMFPVVLCLFTCHQISALQLFLQIGCSHIIVFVGWKYMTRGLYGTGMSHLGSASLTYSRERI